MKRITLHALKPLLGLPLRGLGRSANLLSVHFGNLREMSAREGGPGTAPEWTIQIQCPWRISQGSRIVVAYRDFYFSDVPLKNVAVMTKSRFDSVIAGLCAEFAEIPPVVRRLETDDTGGFSIHLSDDYCLEAFPAENTESGKCWRIFEPVAQGQSFVFPPSEDFT